MTEENSAGDQQNSIARGSTVDSANSQQQKIRLTADEMKDKLLRATAHWTHENLEAKLGENAMLLSKWTLLLDRDEKRGGVVSEADAKEHAAVKKQLHESLGFLTKYVQVYLSMRPETNKRSLDEVEVGDHQGEAEHQDNDSNKRSKVEMAVEE